MTRCQLSRFFPALCALALILAAGQVSATNGTPAAATQAAEPGAPPAEAMQAKSLRRAHAYRFVVEGDSFRRAEQVDAARLGLPQPVLREARGTYLQINTPEGPMWLERMQLVLDRSLQVKAECPPGLSAVGDRTIAGTSGVGEGC